MSDFITKWNDGYDAGHADRKAGQRRPFPGDAFDQDWYKGYAKGWEGAGKPPPSAVDVWLDRYGSTLITVALFVGAFLLLMFILGNDGGTYTRPYPVGGP